MRAQIVELMVEILKALTPVFALLISYIGLKINKYLNAKIKDEELKTTMEKVNSIIVDVVKDVEQAYVKKEKAANNEILPPESAEVAKSLAFDKVKYQLGDKIFNDLKKKNLTAAPDEFLKTKIEAKVFDMKNKPILALLPIILLLLTSCTSIKPAVDNLKVYDDLVRTSDAGVAKWYTSKNEDCIQQGINSRKASINIGMEPTDANLKGKDTYQTCIKHPTDVALEIADIIDHIREDNKNSAKIILDVAKRERPDGDLGTVSEDTSIRLKRLRYLITKEDIH